MKQKVMVAVVVVVGVIVVGWLAKSCFQGGPPPVKDAFRAMPPGEIEYEEVRDDLAGIKGLSGTQQASLLQKLLQKRVKWEGWVLQVTPIGDQMWLDMDPPGSGDKPEVYVQVVTADVGGVADATLAFPPGQKVAVAGVVAQVLNEGVVMVRGGTVVKR
jgi:hypothetical protein